MTADSLFNLSGLPVYVIPILIFLARILDVSTGTLRIILVARGQRLTASVLGFFEVLIWLLAISQIIQNLTNFGNYLAYAAGFAAGTYIGMTIERKLSLGKLLVRVIVPIEAGDLVMYLIARDYRVTYVDAEGIKGPVKIIFTVVKRDSLKEVLRIIKQFDPKAFYTIEDVRPARNAQMPANGSLFRRGHLLQPFYWFRKGK